MNSKTIWKILLFVGIGALALYLIKMMKGGSSSLPGSSGTPGAGVSWLNPFGTTTATAQPDNTGALITAGANAFTGLVGSLKGDFGGGSTTAPDNSGWSGDNYFGITGGSDPWGSNPDSLQPAY